MKQAPLPACDLPARRFSLGKTLKDHRPFRCRRECCTGYRVDRGSVGKLNQCVKTVFVNSRKTLSTSKNTDDLPLACWSFVI